MTNCAAALQVILVAGIKHKKNEIFLDVVERLNLLVAANGFYDSHGKLENLENIVNLENLGTCSEF